MEEKIKVLIANVDTPNYVRAMEHVGAECVNTREIPASIEEYDALILPGGDDIDPVFFHEEMNGTREVDHALDVTQLTLCRLFAEAGKPILGICKGAQIINVCFGGGLIQDLPDGVRERHSYHSGLGTGEYHKTVIEPGTFLHDLYGDSVVTNSYHHQALGRLGDGLTVIQKSDDNVIEFITHESLPIYGSQWHPEKNCWETAEEGVADGAPLFVFFAEKIRECRRPTLKKLLTNALRPCGQTLYVWGGGWNKEDDGAGEDGVRIGLNPQWKAYFDANAGSYDYDQHRFAYGDGLDCSGFVGWTVYNTFEHVSGQPGYVTSSTVMAKTFAEKGYGTYVPNDRIDAYRPGDIVSMEGHVWICLGQCADGSAVLVHSSPNTGVQISGTMLPGKEEKTTQSYWIAENAMAKYFPECHRHYATRECDLKYRTGNLMHWDLEQGVLTDPDGFAKMGPREIIDAVLGKRIHCLVV